MKTTTVKTTGRRLKAGLKKPGMHSVISVDEQPGEYIVYVVVPGMQREDFTITIEKRQLVISASKREAIHCFEGELEQPRWVERYTLPADADAVMTAAVYRNGELQVHIPKGIPEEIKDITEIFVY